MKQLRNSSQASFYLGEFRHSLDPQRRIAIPSSWRRDKGETRLYLLPGRHRTLQLIPGDTFRELLAKVKKVSFADADASLALARLGAMSQECVCDGQGRIQIPQKLAEYAALKGNIVLVGALTSIQLWPEDKWDKSGGSGEQILDVVQKIGERPDDLVDILKGKL